MEIRAHDYDCVPAGIIDAGYSKQRQCLIQ